MYFYYLLAAGTLTFRFEHHGGVVKYSSCSPVLRFLIKRQEKEIVLWPAR
jgi:hypothetical protein